MFFSPANFYLKNNNLELHHLFVGWLIFRREESHKDVFPTGRVENAPRDSVDWHFANIVQGRGRKHTM